MSQAAVNHLNFTKLHLFQTLSSIDDEVQQ